MQIYLVRGAFRARADGAAPPVIFCDTRAEAKREARDLVQRAAGSPDSPPIELFTANVHRVEVSSRFGKGRRFVVALLNREAMLDEGEAIDSVSAKAKTLRCHCCGKPCRAQSLLRPEKEPNQLVCGGCYEEMYLFDDPTPEQEDADRLAHERDHGPEVAEWHLGRIHR